MQQPTGHSDNTTGQYDFILKDPPKKKRLSLPGNGGSKKQRLIIIIGVVLTGLTLFILILALIFGNRGDSVKNIKLVAAQQQEIIRIAEIGEKDARSAKTQSFAVSTKLSITSSQQQVFAYLAKKKQVPKGKELALAQSSKNNTILQTAAENGQFDQVFEETMTSLLLSYQKSLSKYYKSASSATQKQLLQDAYVQAKQLTTEQAAEDSTTTP